MKHAKEATLLQEAPSPQQQPPTLEKESAGEALQLQPLLGTLLQEEIPEPSSSHPTQQLPHPLEVEIPSQDLSTSLPPTMDPVPNLYDAQQQAQRSPKASIYIQNRSDTTSNTQLPHNTNDNTLIDDQTILEQLQPVSQANNGDQRLPPDSGDGDTTLTRQGSATRPPMTLNTSSETFDLKDMGDHMSPPLTTPKIVLSMDWEPSAPAVPAPFNQHNPNDRKDSTRSVSTLTSLLAAEKVSHGSPTIKKRPGIQPYYHAFGNMGALYPTGSLSYNSAIPSTPRRDSATSSLVSSIAELPSESTEQAPSPYDSDQQDQQHQYSHHFHRPHFHGLRRSLSMGKTGKTGFTTRLKNLRQKHGAMSQDGFTSGESDSEYMQDAPLDPSSTPRPTALPPRLKKVPDSTMPLPPTRLNSSASTTSLSTSMGTPYGYGGMGVAPLSISTKFIGTLSGHHSASTTDLTAIREHRDLPRDSSTTRLKEMLKRNVGLSSPALSTASLTPPTSMASPGGVLDDLQPYQSRFSVSRLTGRRKGEHSRLRRGDSSLGTSRATFATSDEEEPLTIPSRQHRYRHLFHRHDSSRQASPGIGDGKNAKDGSRRKERTTNVYIPSVSKALQEARANNNDPNTLLAELEPLPPKFVLAFSALKRRYSPAPSVDTTSITGPGSLANKIINIPPLPVLMYAIPSIAPGTGYAVGGGGGGRGSPGQKSTTMTAISSGGTNVPFPSSSLPRLPPSHVPVPEKLIEPTPLCTKVFLFKSYQNSRFQGHYIFRIVQDRVEYGKLPVTKESCCSQYFRQADVTYRLLEKNYRLSKDAKQEMLVQHQHEWAERRRLSKEEKFMPLWSTLDKNLTTMSAPVPRKKSVVMLVGGYETDSDHATTLASSRATFHGDARAEKKEESYMQEANPQRGPVRVLLSGRGDSGVLTQSSKMDAPLTHQVSDNATSEERRRDSDLSTVRSVTPELPPTPPPEISVMPPPELSLTPPPEFSPTPSPPELSLIPPPPPPEATLSPSPPNLENTKVGLVPKAATKPLLLPRLSYEQAWQEAQMQAVDDAYWYRRERDRCLEAAEAHYGLDLYLSEITRGVEYERFEAVAQTEILNENRDTTLFTIMNGDKTNVMWLESPSVKLKNEFMNWFAIAVMGRGEPEVACSVIAESSGKTHLDLLVENSVKRTPTKIELKERNADILIDLTSVQLTLLEKKISEKRQQICAEMSLIEDVLGQLDNLDESAKRTATSMLNAIETQEVQLALQPSITTGLTLAETVVQKLKEVDERIVACTKVMTAARHNLNRLRYEAELELRSMRRIRQYKIVIGVILLVLLTVLYYRRQIMAAAATALEATSSSAMSMISHRCVASAGGQGGAAGEEKSLFSAWNPREFLMQHMQDVVAPDSDEALQQCPSSLF